MSRDRTVTIIACAAILAGLWAVAPAGDARAEGPQWVGGLAVMNQPRHAVSVTALGGKVYVIGGLRPNGDPTSLMEVYDPWTNRWSAAASIPAEVSHIATVSTGGKIYAFGGLPEINNVYAYDPRTNIWEGRARMPIPRGGMGVAVMMVAV